MGARGDGGSQWESRRFGVEIRLEGLRSGRDGRTALGVVGAWVNVMTPMLAASKHAPAKDVSQKLL